MIYTNEGYDRLEYFSANVPADSRRKEFDIKNHSLIHSRQNPSFLFIGDSITHYWELNAYFNLPGQLIVNRGIGGDTTTYLLKRFWVDAMQLSPKYCILNIGINDSLDLEEDYWRLIPGKPYTEVLQTAKANLNALVNDAVKHNLNLILTSLLPIALPISSCEPLRMQFIQDLNVFLYTLSQKNHYIFVDYYSAAVKEDGVSLMDGITYDGLHPNGKGYTIMCSVLKMTLKKHGIPI